MNRSSIFFLLAAAVALSGSCATLSPSAGLSETGDPIKDAQYHAAVDGKAYKATGWGAIAFGASILISPLLGGGGTIAVAELIEPDVDIPAERLAYAQKTFKDSGDYLLYQTQYKESMVKPVRKERSRRAWAGTGLAVAVYAALIAAVVSAYSAF